MFSEACTIAFSGEICSGKSSVTKVLVEQYGFSRVSTGEYLFNRAIQEGLNTERQSLQEFGDMLDQETGGYWLVDLVENIDWEGKEPPKLILDSVRKDFQISILKDKYSGIFLHVHLEAPDNILKKRFYARKKAKENYDQHITYEEAKQNPTEAKVGSLLPLADIKFDTEEYNSQDIANQVIETIKSILPR
ncbi:MAG: AAA family ATPase [Candidatus Poribacteria bacterium]|nr:AAA family ATPase [Candidatus Poribacteria bacterium]